MFKLLFVFLAFGSVLFSQSKVANPDWFKSEHFVVYNKCKVAVICCENTQQDYIFCGSSRNCYGLYVNLGDTFFVNLENKTQNVNVVGDISFQNYLPAIANYTFQFIVDCIPPSAIQIAIPLSAVPGSSFEIVAQNTLYDPPQPPFSATIPLPMMVYVGGQQPVNSTALSNYTTCNVINEIDTTSTDVSVDEMQKENYKVLFYPNPASTNIHLQSNIPIHNMVIKIYNSYGTLVKSIKDTVDFEVGELGRGFYYAYVLSENKVIDIEKIAVMRE